jgi:KDO2-lipid IV(A) lauroyltransferase
LMPFFGRPAPIPLGTAAIALRLGTPLLPVCVYRLPDDSYMAEATPHVVATNTGDRKVDEVRITEELLRRIEGFIRSHPDQWHVPHRIWEGSP